MGTESEITVGFIGNPNCGKTTLFNVFTGANLKVANWPGVTVERVEGETSYKGRPIKLIDLPGIYSLTSYSIEEKVSRKCIMEEHIDVIVNVVDASSLERNLYLTLQLLEMGKPVILALNMMDIVEERGMEIDLHRLPELLGGIPVVPVSARKKTGLDVLLHAVIHHYEEGSKGSVVHYQKEIEDLIAQTEKKLETHYGKLVHKRWYAIKLLERDEEVLTYYPLGVLSKEIKYEKQIINQKYDYIEEIIEETLVNKDAKAQATDKIDHYLTHPILGVPIFLGIMAMVFFLTFTIGDFLKGYFEVGLEIFSKGALNILEKFGIAEWLISLIVDGIIAGVGGILTFLPNIFILFLALAFLEDSGYMARVAVIMERGNSTLRRSGKANLTKGLGFGCSVPPGNATRALEKEKDRKKTILVTPFMSCSARLPIYVLFADMFFEKYAIVVAYSLYLIGVFIAILIAMIVNKLEKQKEPQNTLLIELPEYKSPNARTIAIYVWEKVKDYLTKAGTTIFIASIILWFLLNYNIHGMTEDVAISFGAAIGRFLEPILRPAGLGMWQIGVALISGISAKEVVVSSFSVLFGVGNINSAAGMTELTQALAGYGFGALNAYALMIFCLLYTPCVATIATIKKETNSWKWTIGMIGFQLVFAWSVATLVYQIGRVIF